MALVKKLQSGGVAPEQNTPKPDYTQIEKALYDDLYSMPSKEARRAKPAYDQVASLIRSGALDKAVKFNPDRTYSIDVNQLPEELKGMDWTGHENPLEKDLLGFGSVVRGKDSNKEALSSAMSAVRAYTESSTPATTATTVGGTGVKYKKNLQDLGRFVVDTHFKGNEDNWAGKFSSITDDQARRDMVLGWANENIDKYLENAQKEGTQFDYEDLKAAQDFKNLLKDPSADWNKISDKAYELGWNLNNFLMKPEEKAALQEKQVQEKATDYTEMGLSADMSALLIGKGYTETREGRPIYKGSQRQEWFDKYLKDQNALVFYNPTTKKEVIIKGNDFLQASDFDQFHPGYETTWTQDLDSGITFGKKKGVLKDYGNVGKELIVEGIDPGSKVYGWADTGTGDYLKRLQIVLPSGSKQELTRQSDGIYVNSTTGETLDLKNKIKGFGGSHLEVSNYGDILKQEENPLSAISSSKPYFNSLGEANEVFKSLKNELATKGTADEDDFNELAATYRYLLRTGNPESRELVLEKYAELTDLFKRKNIPVVDKYRHAGFSYKNGGVVIAQKGMSFKEYTKKYNVAPTGIPAETPTTKANEKFVSNKGTLGNMDGWETASLVGTGISLIPGVGVVGGAITTVADAVTDASDGDWSWGDTGNLAMNIGFTALSFFGAGAVGAAFKGTAKGVKLADKAFDIGKVVQKANRLGAVPGVKNSLEAVGKLALNSSDDIAKTITKLGKAEDAAEIIAKLGVKNADEARALLSHADEAIKYVNNSGLKHALGIPQIAELVKVSPEILQKAAKYGMGAVRGATIAGGISGGIDIVKDAKEYGISGVHVDDIKRTAFGIHAGAQWLSNKETLRALERQAIQNENAASTTFKIKTGDVSKDLKISEAIKEPDKKKAILGLVGKKKVEASNTENLNKYKKDIAAAYAKENKIPLTDEQINSIHDATPTRATKLGTYSIGEDPKMNKSIWRDARDYKLAKKAIEKYQGKSITKVTDDIAKGEKPTEESITVAAKRKIKIDKEKGKKLVALMKEKKDLKKVPKKTEFKNGQGVIPFEFKEGGILRYAEPAQGISYNSNVANIDYENKARKGYLPYTNLNKVSNWQTTNGEYTPEYTSFINSIDNNWVAQNREDMNKYIQSVGGDILTKDAAQIKRLATDKLYGPYHNYMTNAFERQRMQPLAAPKVGIQVGPIKTPPLKLPPLKDIKEGTTFKGKNPPIKLPVLDDMDVKNKMLYLSTLDAIDRQSGKRVEAANQVPLGSLGPNRQITEFNPFAQMAKETEASANRMGRLGYEGTANTAAGLANRAEMWTKGQKATGELLTKGAATSSEHRQQQNEADYATLKSNLQVADQNTANIKAGRARGLETEAQAIAARNTAFNNLLAADQFNSENKKKNQYLSGMYGVSQDPAYKKLREEYAALASEDNPYFKNWKSAMESGASPIEWEKSQDYTNWQSAMKAKQGAMKPFAEQLESIKTSMAYNQPYQSQKVFGSWREVLSQKKGGSLEKKQEKAQEADKRLFYKTIKANNDAVSKESIDMSKKKKKGTKESRKEFYDKIVKNNKAVNKSSKNKK